MCYLMLKSDVSNTIGEISFKFTNYLTYLNQVYECLNANSRYLRRRIPLTTYLKKCGCDAVID